MTKIMKLKKNFVGDINNKIKNKKNFTTVTTVSFYVR